MTSEKTANEKLLDQSIRHALLLQRYKASEVAAILFFLNTTVFPVLVDRILTRLSYIKSRGFDSGVFAQKQYKELVASISELLAVGFKEAGGKLKAALKDFALAESQFATATIQKASPLAFSFEVPTAAQLNSIITSQPMQGRFMSVWLEDVSAATVARVESEIKIGIAQGESVDEIVRRIRGTRVLQYKDGILERSRRDVQSIVQSAVTHVSAHAREAVAHQNEDLIKGMRVLATLDSRTCTTCAGLDGKVFAVGEGPRPPFHPGRCRCSMIYVLRSWKEMGVSLPEAPEGTRASMDGQVPGNTTYGAWLAEQPVSVQNEALGPGKAALFRAGKLEIERFTDNFGRPLTLAQLQEILT